jgi:anti-anti-sigma factor
MSKGVVRARERDFALEVQVEGWGTMHHAPPLRQWAEKSLAAGTRSMRIDLSQAAYMDSTFIGTLLYLKRQIEACPGGSLSLTCPSAACEELLAGMHLAPLFAVHDQPMAGTLWDQEFALPADLKSPEFQRTMVEAHQELAEQSGRAGAPFKHLAAELAREYAGQRRAGNDCETL